MIYVEFAIIILVILTLNRVTAMLNIRYKLVALNMDLFSGLSKRYQKLRFFMKNSEDLEIIDIKSFARIQEIVNECSIPVIEQINSFKEEVVPAQIQFAIDEVVLAESDYNSTLNSYRLLSKSYNDKVESIANRPFVYIMNILFKSIAIVNIESEEGENP